ncbi:MAG: hypothetical protein PHP50_14205 [Lachnospiraceae bacterium]|nr:hypothetical protein [Lachnospiraceae bacterium]
MLADLNGCTCGQISEILLKNGCEISGAKKPDTKNEKEETPVADNDSAPAVENDRLAAAISFKPMGEVINGRQKVPEAVKKAITTRIIMASEIIDEETKILEELREFQKCIC